MKDREFRDYGAKRGLDADQTEAHVRAVRDFEAFLASAGGSAGSLDSAGAEAARDYLADPGRQGTELRGETAGTAPLRLRDRQPCPLHLPGRRVGRPRSGAPVVRPGPQDSGEGRARRRVCRPRIAAARLAP